MVVGRGSGNSERVRVLLVEDNVDHAHLARRGLPEDEGYDVVHVRSGAEALDRAGNEVFDVCLLDYRLPDRRGIDVCGEIIDDLDDALILLVTGVDREDLVQQAFEAGADDYILKGPDFVDRIADQVDARLGARA
jgi:CheY-like chemotaxis protein